MAGASTTQYRTVQDAKASMTSDKTAVYLCKRHGAAAHHVICMSKSKLLHHIFPDTTQLHDCSSARW